MPILRFLSVFAVCAGLMGTSCAKARVVTFGYGLSPCPTAPVQYPPRVVAGSVLAAIDQSKEWPSARVGADFAYYGVQASTLGLKPRFEVRALPSACRLTLAYYYLTGKAAYNTDREARVATIADTIATVLASSLGATITGTRVRDTLPVGYHLDGSKW